MQGDTIHTPPVVRFRGIHFLRERRPILKGIDWEIKEGERWALIGLNGCGKSTLLGMIPAYTYPSSGTVEVFGNTYGKVAWVKVRRRLGYVSSAMKDLIPSMHRHTPKTIIRSGVENTIGFYEDLTEEQEAFAEQLLSDFSLTEVAEKTYYTLSEGEQRRTLLARAFMNRPDLMVLDEPCAGLDLRGKEELLMNLNHFAQKEGKPLIYVTHSLEEIIPAITHVAIMADGLFVVAGEKRAVLTQDRLRQLYKIPVELEWKYDRPWIRVQSDL
ncbi:MAG: ATP-binding cassette domain-containing protein [Tissierellia bacterium]|nr:ATP-binding cassette domain-containing protein [Tissierellia bacterium]